MGKLTKAQVDALQCLPDWIGVGLPAAVVGVAHWRLKRLCDLGFAEREQPNEEWPYVYALTEAGRSALKGQDHG